jgi:hypothetical protein
MTGTRLQVEKEASTIMRPTASQGIDRLSMSFAAATALKLMAKPVSSA